MRGLEQLEQALQREQAGAEELRARAAGEIVDDQETVQYRQGILADMINEMWKRHGKQLSSELTFQALCRPPFGMEVGVAGFDHGKVDAALPMAQRRFEADAELCVQRICEVWEAYVSHRAPSAEHPLAAAALATELARVKQAKIAQIRLGVINQLPLEELLSRMDPQHPFPRAFVRGQLSAAKVEFNRPMSTDELRRAYMAGPPPDIDDLTDSLAGAALASATARAHRTPVDSGLLERQRAQRSLAHFERTLQLEPVDRVKIAQSRLWREQHAEGASANGTEPPPLRPGGTVRFDGMTKPELNGIIGELVQWSDDRGRWQVNISDDDDETPRVVAVRPNNLLALPDCEPWLNANGSANDTFRGTAMCRYVWAVHHPLQAVSLGTRFDVQSGKPVWFEPPPRHVLEALPSSRVSQIFRGSLTEHIAVLREQARPHASDPPHDPLDYMQHALDESSDVFDPGWRF